MSAFASIPATFKASIDAVVLQCGFEVVVEFSYFLLYGGPLALKGDPK